MPIAGKYDYRKGLLMKANVIVDADACPKNCLSILQKDQLKYKYRLITVASYNHVINNEDHIIVGNEKDAADMAVVNQVLRGDLVITQDWGLAALVLGKGGHVLSPSGRIYTNENIGFMLEERAVKAKIRRSGQRTKGPAARSHQDDQRFHRAFLDLLSKME